jgi:hypothetical protein
MMVGCQSLKLWFVFCYEPALFNAAPCSYWEGPPVTGAQCQPA